MPNDRRLYPVQVTQRGVRIFRKLQQPDSEQLAAFAAKAEKRVRAKRKLCREQGVAFVLVRDYLGQRVSRSIAWGDVKSLYYAIENLRRRQ